MKPYASDFKLYSKSNLNICKQEFENVLRISFAWIFPFLTNQFFDFIKYVHLFIGPHWTPRQYGEGPQDATLSGSLGGIKTRFMFKSIYCS